MIVKIQKLLTQLANDYEVQTNLPNRDTFVFLAAAEIYKHFGISSNAPAPKEQTSKKRGGGKNNDETNSSGRIEGQFDRSLDPSERE
jgi:hypothetical protein